MTEQDTNPVADEDMFYGGSYWVWDVPGLGLRVATPGECATKIRRLRQENQFMRASIGLCSGSCCLPEQWPERQAQWQAMDPSKRYSVP